MASDRKWQIQDLVWSLSAENPARRIADTILGGLQPPENALETLELKLRGIRRLRWKEQAVAAWCLGRLELEGPGRESATRVLAELLSQRPRHSIGCFVLSGCLFTYFGFIWIAITSALDGIANRVRAAAAESLGLLGVPESAPALAEAILEMKGKAASGDRSVRIAAAKALPGVLRNLPENGYGQFSQETTADLCKLVSAREEEAVLAGLECLRLMGGSSAVTWVEKAAGHRSAAIRASAQEALTALMSRVERERQGRILLRATSAPLNPADELLRPSLPELEADPSKLLRPKADPEQQEMRMREQE